MEATTATTSLKNIVAKLRHPDDVDRTLGSMNTAWLRQQKADEKEGNNPSLGNFNRNREYLSEAEINFALDWLKADSAASATEAKQPFNIVSPSSNEIADLKREKKLLFDGLHVEKAAKETALQTIANLQNDAKILRGEIGSLEKQNALLTKTASEGLGSQERILNAQILDLKAQNAKNEAKWDEAYTTEFNRRKADKTTHVAELDKEKQARIDALQAYENQIAENDKSWQKRLDDADSISAAIIQKYKDYAAKWESVETAAKKELFLRNLKFAFALVGCLVVVQAVDTAIFTKISYEDAGFKDWWFGIVGFVLCVGFQGISLFMTVNRNKKTRGVKLGVDEYGSDIYEKDENGNLKTEVYYEMGTMMFLCALDFVINLLVVFHDTNILTAFKTDPAKIARLGCFSLIVPLGIYFTSEILLNMIAKRENLIK